MATIVDLLSLKSLKSLYVAADKIFQKEYFELWHKEIAKERQSCDGQTKPEIVYDE